MRTGERLVPRAASQGAAGRPGGTFDFATREDTFGGGGRDVGIGGSCGWLAAAAGRFASDYRRACFVSAVTRGRAADRSPRRFAGRLAAGEGLFIRCRAAKSRPHLRW